MPFIDTFDNGDTHGAARTIVNQLAGRANETGWASYLDGQYSTGSPFALTGNDTWVNLPNNAAVTLEGQLPQDVAHFYNPSTQKISGKNGDGILLTVEMTARPTTGAMTYLDVAINIGGSLGRIYPQMVTFPKGNGVDRQFAITVNGYTLDTWEANGGQIQVKANANMAIYGVRYVITRTHRAR